MIPLLWPYVRRYWIRYFFGFLCLVGTATLAMLIPYLVRLEINLLAQSKLAAIPPMTLLLCVVAVAMGLVRWVSRFVIFNCGRDIESELRRDLFSHLLKLGPDFYQRFSTGDLMSRLVNDLTALRLVVGFGILTALNAPLYYLYALGILLSINPRLALLTLLPFGLLLIAIRKLARSLMDRTLEVQQGLGLISAKVQETLFGIHVVKAYVLEECEEQKFKQINDVYNQKSLALARLRAAIAPLMRMASTVPAVIVLTYGGYLVLERRMMIGDLAGFMGYLALLASPTTSLAWVISIYQRGRAAAARLKEILDVPAYGSHEYDCDGAVLEIKGELEWENVWFTYSADASDGIGSQDKWILKNINVRVPAGSKLAIVGRTGAGKTTMVNLLLRLIEPTYGRVLLDGRDLRTLPLHVVRRAIGIATQHPTIFSNTIANNIAFATPQEPVRIEAAARDAGLGRDLELMPSGLQTIVGERGLNLSGGQKQRVGVARLLSYEPQVFVLDDALSSVDAETERFVLERLAQRCPDRTMIVVSHRISAIRDADQIVVLEQGAIVESGTHEELMTREGIYAELFRRQMLEEEVAEY